MKIDKTLKALNDKNRREILKILRDGPLSAGEIAEKFDMSSATVSYHLSVLLEGDLVFLNKEKNYRIYTLNTSVFEDLMSFLIGYMEE